MQDVSDPFPKQVGKTGCVFFFFRSLQLFILHHFTPLLAPKKIPLRLHSSELFIPLDSHGFPFFTSMNSHEKLVNPAKHESQAIQTCRVYTHFSCWKGPTCETSSQLRVVVLPTPPALETVFCRFKISLVRIWETRLPWTWNETIHTWAWSLRFVRWKWGEGQLEINCKGNSWFLSVVFHGGFEDDLIPPSCQFF